MQGDKETETKEQNEDNGSDENQDDLSSVDEKKRAEDYLDNWQRSQADFSNYKRRMEQERTDLIRYSGASVVGSLLSVVDDMERALVNVPPQMLTMTWVEGIAIIYKKLVGALESHGVIEIETSGQEFDPHLHQAISQVAGPEGVIVTELQKGYKMHDRILRPSLVQVGDGSEQENEAQAESDLEDTSSSVSENEETD
tara:strand:- start:191 stop:784 length:594 start_codon:yes stop_codon:yes gene_type:complete